MTEQIPDEVVPAGAPNSRRAAIVGLLGVGSLPGLLFCGLGGLLAVIALALAPAARREVEASRGALGGLGLIRIGRICSFISLALVLLALVVIVFVALVLLPDDTYGGG